MSAGAPAWRPWVAHLILVGVILVVCVVAAFGVRDVDELWQTWEEGDEAARVEALHIIACRGEVGGERLDRKFARNLLEDEDRLVREMAFTGEVCKWTTSRAQGRYLSNSTGLPTDDWWRGLFLHRRKAGGPELGTMEMPYRADFQWFFDSVAGRPLPKAAMLRHLGEADD